MNANDKDLEKKKKDINSLDQIVNLATSLQDQLSRYNARQSSFDALYHKRAESPRSKDRG